MIYLIDQCLYNHNSNSFININNLQNNFVNTYFTELNEHYTELNSLDLNTYSSQILDTLNNYKSNNNFSNFLLNKPKFIEEFAIDDKGLQSIDYILYNNHTISNNIFEYLMNYDFKNITTKTYSKTELYKLLVESKFNTKFTKNINNFGNQLKSAKYTNIAKYLNDFELLEVISDNSSSYNRAYYKIIELLIDNKQIKSDNFKLLSLEYSPGNFVRYIKNHIHQKNPNWNNFDIITLLNNR